MTAKVCAYCKEEVRLTREHIWPNGFLKRGDFDLKFSERAGKTFRADLVIADVCEPCNNGVLSTLDDHACQLYDRRFSKYVEPLVSVKFSYDYSKFCRWLLKVSFNSARSVERDLEVFERHVSFILEGVHSRAFAVSTYSIAPSSIKRQPDGVIEKFYPQMARCGPVIPVSVNPQKFYQSYVTRIIQINSFAFILCLPRHSEKSVRQCQNALRAFPGQLLNPNGEMRIGPPAMATLEAADGIGNWPEPRG